MHVPYENDDLYETIEWIDGWEVRTVSYRHPEYPRLLLADCLPMQLRHRRSGIVLFSVTWKTGNRWELHIPQGLIEQRELADDSESALKGPAICNLSRLRFSCYLTACSFLESEFGVYLPPLGAVIGYAMCDRPGPDEWCDR